MTATRFYTLDDARADCPNWFADDTNRFFGTSLLRQWPLGDSVWILTSEQPPHRDTTYNVHRHSRSGHRFTIGPRIDIGLGTREQAEQIAEACIRVELAGRLTELISDDYVACEECARQKPADAVTGEAARPEWAQFRYCTDQQPFTYRVVCETCLPAVIIECEEPPYFVLEPDQILQAAIQHFCGEFAKLAGTPRLVHLLAEIAERVLDGALSEEALDSLES